MRLPSVTRRAAHVGLAAVLLIAACTPRTEAGRAAVGTATPAASATVAPAPSSFPRTVTDRAKQSLTITARPVRIVSLAPGITETLFAIGAGPRVVASDTFSDYPEGARRTEKLDYSRPSAEQVVALRPDLVLMSARQRDVAQRFRDLQLPIVYLGEPATLDEVFDNMLLIGAATGEDAAAADLVRALRQRVEMVRARAVTAAGASDGPRVFYELTPALHSASAESFIGSMFTLLRARNIAPGPTPFPQLTAERVIAADPEVIFLAYVGSTKVDPRAVEQRPGWGGVSAVRTGRVVVVDPDVTNRAGPRVVDALEAIAKALYP